MQLVRSHDSHVATLSLPGGRLSAAAARWLSDTCLELIEDRDLRAVVIEAPVDFCSGPGDDLVLHEVDPDPVTAVSRLRVPVVAAIRGSCRSVGLELALACDIRLATGDSTFAISDVVDGSLPMWGGTQRLPRAVGSGRATWMLMTGETVDSRTGEVWGLVHELVEDLDGAVAQVLEQLAGTGPLALEFAKEAVHRGSELSLRDGLRLEGDLNHQLAATDDRAEGLRAFFDKRPPDFSGR